MKKRDKTAFMVKSYNELYKNYKTKKQWLKLGYNIKEKAKGILLYTNGTCKETRLYYSEKEVIKVR